MIYNLYDSVRIYQGIGWILEIKIINFHFPEIFLGKYQSQEILHGY